MNIEIDFAFRLVLPSYILKSSRMDEAVSFYMRVEKRGVWGVASSSLGRLPNGHSPP